MEPSTKLVEAKLANGSIIHIQATALGGEKDVAFTIPSFEGVTDAITGIASSMIETLQTVKPRKASIEFGLEVAVDSGSLTAILVKGSGNTSLKITLEWGE